MSGYNLVLTILNGKKHDEKRKRKEQDIRNQCLMQMIKGANNERTN